MKFFFKCVLGFLGVFWLTVSLLKVATELDEYIVSKKTEENKVEISKNISKKGNNFVVNNMESLNLITTDIENLDSITKDGKIVENEFIKSKELINNIISNNEILKNINQKKEFSNLDDFRNKIKSITTEVDEYCMFLNIHIDEGESLDIGALDNRKGIIFDTSIKLEEVVKTYEVN